MLNKVITVIFIIISDICLAESTVIFEGVGSPSFLTIEGKGGKVTGSLTMKDGKSSGTFEVNLNDFDTGIALRNEHMKKQYLETDTYPIAKFILDPIIIPKDGKFNWSGNMTLHGVTKGIDGYAEVLNKVIDVSFSIKMSDFKIKKAIYLGVGMDDKISIALNIDIP